MWVLQHHAVHAFDISTIIVFVYLGLQVKWNQFSSKNSHHISCIYKGSHDGKWPDLMTSKPDFVSTLGYHWADHAGRPLEPQAHWDATGTTLADARTQWCSSGDPVLICIIGTHWKTTGRPLEAHWKLATNNPFSSGIPVYTGSKFQAHWIATELPLARGKGKLDLAENRFYDLKRNWSSRVIEKKIDRDLNHTKMNSWDCNSKRWRRILYGPDQNVLKFDFQVKFDLEDHGLKYMYCIK